ncbi:uncharacterized protein [Miscanthus floridulus]|uniref:uncharacterized protein n=1 Tax=Miscanthus floridulus TaxID=154761 RepID=UPI003457656A
MWQQPTHGAWCYLKDKFLGQRESRALLETQLCNFCQDALSITDYCCHLESMATSLAKFGDPIGDWQLVLTLLRGLSGKFCHMVSILKMHRPFLTFAEAQTHLLLEEMEIDAQPPLPPSALVATTPCLTVPDALAPPPLGMFPPVCPPSAPTGGQRNGRCRRCGGCGGPSAPPGGAPPSMHGGMHPSFVHPWAGTMQMWPYDRSGRPPLAPLVFTIVPQYGGFGGAYGGTYGPRLLSTSTSTAAPAPKPLHAVHGTVHMHGDGDAAPRTLSSPGPLSPRPPLAGPSVPPLTLGAAAPVHPAWVAASSATLSSSAPPHATGSAAPEPCAQAIANGTGRTISTRPVAIILVTNTHSMRTHGKVGIA